MTKKDPYLWRPLAAMAVIFALAAFVSDVALIATGALLAAVACALGALIAWLNHR